MFPGRSIISVVRVFFKRVSKKTTLFRLSFMGGSHVLLGFSYVCDTDTSNQNKNTSIDTLTA